MANKSKGRSGVGGLKKPWWENRVKVRPDSSAIQYWFDESEKIEKAMAITKWNDPEKKKEILEFSEKQYTPEQLQAEKRRWLAEQMDREFFQQDLHDLKRIIDRKMGDAQYEEKIMREMRRYQQFPFSYSKQTPAPIEPEFFMLQYIGGAFNGQQEYINWNSRTDQIRDGRIFTKIIQSPATFSLPSDPHAAILEVARYRLTLIPMNETQFAEKTQIVIALFQEYFPLTLILNPAIILFP